MEFANQNQMIAGALSLWGLTVITYIARGVPMAIYRFVQRNMVTSVTMNNTSYEKEIMMTDFLWWFEKNRFTNWSRTFMVSPKVRWEKKDKANALTAGYGIHFFFYKRSFFWMKIDKLDSSGSERQKEEITLFKLGRSNNKFKQIIDDFTPDLKDIKFIYNWKTDGGWQKTREVVPKPLASVAMNDNIKQFINRDVPNFINMKDWYRRHGLPYKLTAILEGPPGTGKTSLLRAIATEFDKNICTININDINDSGFAAALTNAPPSSIIAVEDFDSTSAVKSREVIRKDEGDGVFQFLSLSGILNALDGVSTLDDTMVFLTTNHLNSIDPAMYRKGRVDKIVHVGPLTAENAKEYSESLFPKESFNDIFKDEIVGCHLHSALLDSKGDVNLYKESISEVYSLGRNLESS